MTTSEKISQEYPEILLADGFETALVGIAHQYGREPVALYDREKCIQSLIDRDGMSRTDAEEFIEYNVIGAYVGDKTPVFAEFPF